MPSQPIILHFGLLMSNSDDSMSGSMAITMIVKGKNMYVVNVGNCRAVIVQRTKGYNEAEALDLSCNQTPFSDDEYKQCNHRVMTFVLLVHYAFGNSSFILSS